MDSCPSHSLAMSLLQNGVDITVITLWLGHESIETTQLYLHSDLAMKEKALARTIDLKTTPKRYQPNDRLLAWRASELCRVGNHRILQFTKKIEGFKPQRDITSDAA